MTSSSRPDLVVGAAGMLGTELVTLLRRRGERPVEEAIWPDLHDGRAVLDITDATAVTALLARLRPAAVYNCAAYTDVDGAETDEATAQAVNGQGPANLARACKAIGAKLLHVSTDYVFEGVGRIPYRPDDPPNPQGAYGRSKLAGERAIQEIGGSWVIVRTSWLFGRHGRNFIATILELARQRNQLRVVDDQIGCPTYAADLARCLADLAQQDVRGIFHFCNPPACSWFEFAARALELAGLTCRIEPCSTSEFPRPARRPAWSVLDCRDTINRLGWSPRPWPAALVEYLGGEGGTRPGSR